MLSDEINEKEMLEKVEILPKSRLEFEGTIDDTRQQQIVVTNLSGIDVAFKLKGTSPDVIKIRPGYGFLRPGNKAVISVELHPLRDRPRPPCRERLVVLLAMAPPDKRWKRPADFWRKGSATAPVNPFRNIIPIKIEGFEGFKTDKSTKSRADRSITAKSKSGRSKSGRSKSGRSRSRKSRSDRKSGKEKRKKKSRRGKKKKTNEVEMETDKGVRDEESNEDKTEISLGDDEKSVDSRQIIDD